jgi:parvulin-like peptidyl-prolyl isomerase
MTRKSKRTQLIFWLIIIGLLVSMVIAFTPTLNGLFGSQQAQQQGEPALIVNGQTVYSLEVAQAQQNPPFNQGFQGEIGDDLNLLLADTLIQNQVFQQASSNIRVSDGDVRARLNQFREENNVAGARNDTAYLNMIGNMGFNDATFREALRDQIRFERFRDGLTNDVTVSDEEVRSFYDLNPEAYQSEERIRARQLVVSDQAKADDLLAQARGGADFATLAKDNSEELADRNGALGAASGSTDPQPVGRAALPTAVSQAAFALQGPGITDVIAANEKFYIVSVEEFVPAAVRPFEEVQEEARTDALEAKKQGALSTAFDDLMNQAQVSVPEGSVLVYDDPVVAKVGDSEIKKSELVNAVYRDPQMQQALQPGMEQLISLFKPNYLEQLIDRELAYQGSGQLEGATFFGSKGQIAQQALQFVSKDAAVTPEELQTYYDENLETRFTIPASAVANRVDFTTQEAATAFRTAMLEGGELQATAEANGGIVADLGTVQPGSLPTELDTALFGTDAFDALPNSEETISDILVIQEPVEETPSEETPSDTTTEEATTEDATTEETATGETDTATTETTEPATRDVYVVLVGTRTPEEVRPFEEVTAIIEQEVLNQKRSELQQAWLNELKTTIPVENLLASVTPPAQEAAPTFETTPLPGVNESGTTEPTTTEPETQETPATEEAAPTEGSETPATPEESAAPATEDTTTETTQEPAATEPETAEPETTTPESEAAPETTTPATETTDSSPTETTPATSEAGETTTTTEETPTDESTETTTTPTTESSTEEPTDAESTNSGSTQPNTTESTPNSQPSTGN